MNESLLNHAERVHRTVKRNVVKLPTTETMLGHASPLFEKALRRAQQVINPSHPGDDFYYSTAIEYPFKSEPYLVSRYSDGTFPVWYGSKTLETTIHETLYHRTKHLLATTAFQQETDMVSYRNVFDVFCDALLVNVSDKTHDFPQLTANDYQFTQKLGKQLHDKHYAGLISLSARDTTGTNYNIFQQAVLSQPTLSHQLTYTFNFPRGVATISESNEIVMELKIPAVN